MTTQPPSDRRDRPSALNDPASRDQEVRTVAGDRGAPGDRDFITDLTTLGNEWVNITLTGSRPAVRAMVNLLHQVNVIGASEWSKAIAIKSTPVIIRVASRGLRTE
jgi:hypothetical protein